MLTRDRAVSPANHTFNPQVASVIYLPSLTSLVWPDGVAGAVVRALAFDSRGRAFSSRPFRCQVTTLGKLFTYVPLSPSSTIGTSRGAAMSCDWEGNRRYGVALATRHRLKWFIHLRAQGLSEMSTPTTLLLGYGTLYLFTPQPQSIIAR